MWYWSYCRAEFPCERLLHLTAAGTRWCFCRGRQHKSQLVMASFDLLHGRAYQRCWDAADCVVHARGGVKLKARHALTLADKTAFPTWSELDAFEQASDRCERDANG